MGCDRGNTHYIKERNQTLYSPLSASATMDVLNHSLGCGHVDVFLISLNKSGWALRTEVKAEEYLHCYHIYM
jgi:hypothetical protein